VIRALPLLALLLWQQASPPKLVVEVDRDRVVVGDEIVFAVTAVSRSAVPMQVAVAPPSGLEIVARSERTEVGFDNGPSRTTTLEIHLRALRPGRWQLGPVEARQGSDTVTADAVTVEVIDAPQAAQALLDPRARQLVEHTPPPRQPGAVALTVTLSADSVRTGEQVDVVTAAWFPRDLRIQLRRPPVLLPPVIAGVWSYSQPTPPGIAATREVGGQWYDLFVAHQVVFPLVAGYVHVPAAELRYSVPVALQFFSQEERYSIQSRPATLTVLPLSDRNRPADFTGAVARGLQLDRTITPAMPHAGEAVTVDVALTGAGNLALWPPPELAWPAGVRAYADRVDERVTTTAGRLGGTKTFRYLVVPESTGTVQLPALHYSYFDIGTNAYADAATPAVRLAVGSGGEAMSARALPPDLLRPAGPALADRVLRGVALPVWVALLALPPLLVLVARRPRRRRAVIVPPPSSLEAAERRLESAVRAIVADPAQRDGAHLLQALRGAGLEPALAARIAQVRTRLSALRYGPEPGAVDAALIGEAEELAARLDTAGRATLTRGVAVALALLSLCLGGRLTAQAPTPERLYATGALRAAADGFAERTRLQPDDAANWYDLGAARYRIGEDATAAAAWLRAERLAPRDRTVRRALRLTPSPDDVSDRRRWVPPLTARELVLAALALWVVGWALLLSRRSGRGARVVLGAALALGALGAAVTGWVGRPLVLATGAEPARLSPHGRAPVVATLESGTALRPVSRHGGWLLVEGPSGLRGWLPASAVAIVAGGGE
jgi:hypothetical protein